MPLATPSYPISLVLAGRRCLVVGGGPVALRKAEGLVAAGARVTVVSPDVVDGIVALRVDIERRPYAAGEAGKYFLVVSATGRPDIDHAVHADGEAAGVLVNAADDLPACSFILPAVLRRGAVSVAVSTDGTAPALAGWLRDRVAAVVGPETEVLALLLGEARASLHAAGRSSEGLGWRELLDGAVPGLLASGDTDRARAEVVRWTTAQLATRCDSENDGAPPGPLGLGGPVGGAGVPGDAPAGD